MNKTKLGINEYAFVALIFLAAIMGPIPMLGLILYAAVAEKSEIINAGSRLAIIVKAGFLLFTELLDFITYIGRACDPDAYDFFNVMSRIDYVIEAIFIATFIVFIVINFLKSLSGKPANVVVSAPQAQAPVQPAAPVQPQAPAQPAAAPAPAAAPTATKCPKCGKELAAGTTFCPACGTKVQ